jgi:hypothetical protein
MFDSKFLITLTGIVVVVFAICNQGAVKSNEGFLGNLPSMKAKVWRSVGNQKGDLYSIPGQYQAMLSPRSNAGVDYGANIRYNMPSYENQAVPCDPLSMGDMAKENYSRESYGCGHCGGGCSAASCDKMGASKNVKGYNPEVESSFSSGNYDDVMNNVYSNSTYPEAASMLPVGDMTTLDSAGQPAQVVTYDRIVYANRNSRLRGRGDPIRGDLPIVPCSAEWFRPSVHPQIDLQEGAMNVMGGIGNQTSMALDTLISTASGGTDTTLGGVNMANQFTGRLGAALNDVSVSAFP